MAKSRIVDAKTVFQVLNKTRREPVDDRRYLDKEGYVADMPWDMLVKNQVSQALEQAKADKCAGRLATDLGYDKEAKFFHSRASRTFKLWDSKQDLFAPLSE